MSDTVPTSSDGSDIRVILIEDHVLVAQGLARLLGSEPGIEIVGQAASGADGIQLARHTEPDVALVDHRLDGDLDGVEVIAALVAESLVPAVAMVTSAVSETVMVRAIEAGASAFIIKNSSAIELIDAVQALGRGEIMITSAQMAKLLPRMQRADGVGAFTERDQDVLQCLADGLSNPEIGERLFLSVNTVRNYVQRVLNKLEAHSKHEAVATAYRQGLIEPP